MSAPPPEGPQRCPRPPSAGPQRRPGPIPIAGLRGLAAYHVPRHPAPIDLPLHGNEGPPPAPELFATLSDPDLIRRYPSAAKLEALLAARLGGEPAQVLVTAGADEALDRAFRTYVAAGDEVVLPSPTFVMLPHYARVIGAVVRAPSWACEAFPEAEVLAAMNDSTRAVALVSPNNPTGAVIAKEVIVRIARAAPAALMLVDFAYIETADEDPTAEILASTDNALIFRTLSKVWGLAGLRVGYVVGPAWLVKPMRAAGPPYSVSSPSLALAAAHLASGEGAMRAYVAAVRDERARLYEVLLECGARPVHSEANFVFARFASESQAGWFRDGLAALGIGIRVFPGEAGIADGARVTCPGNAAQAERLIAAVRAVTTPSEWSFVKTVDEISAARAAGRVAIALGDPDGPEAQSLLAAGAARVLRLAADMGEVWR